MTAADREPRAPVVVVGIDIGGTATRTAVLAGDEVLAAAVTSTPTDRASAVDDLVGWVAEALHRAGAGPDQLAGIGVGASGPIGTDGRIANPDTLGALTGLDVVGGLAAAFGAPVVIDNDAATAALAEHRAGAGRGTPSLLVVTLGTGVGVAVVNGGALVRGGDGVHPEAGHLTVPGPPAPCYCGRETCFEQTGSRAALQRMARAATGSADLDALTAAALRGESAAAGVMAAYGRRLADGLTELITQHRPGLVVLAGSAAQHLPRYRAALETRLSATTSAPRPEVVLSPLGELAGAIGAAHLVRR